MRAPEAVLEELLRASIGPPYFVVDPGQYSWMWTLIECQVSSPTELIGQRQALPPASLESVLPPALPCDEPLIIPPNNI